MRNSLCSRVILKYLLGSSELISRSMAVQGDVEGEEMLAKWSRDLEAVLYEQEVEEAIREVCPPFTTAPLESFLLPPVVQVCPTSDPLDSKDFDAIDYINQLFPTEQVSMYQPPYNIHLALIYITLTVY